MTVSFDRLRPGELLGAPSGLLLAVSLFLPWYSFPSGNLDAWSSFTVVDLLIASAAVSAVLLTWFTLTRASPALPVAMGIWTIGLGLLACACVVLRLLFPPSAANSPCVGAWLGLAGSALVLLAGWLAISDERPARGVPVNLGP